MSSVDYQKWDWQTGMHVDKDYQMASGLEYKDLGNMVKKTLDFFGGGLDIVFRYCNEGGKYQPPSETSTAAEYEYL